MKLFTKQTAVLLTLAILCLTGCTPTPKGYVKRATAIMDKRGLYATGDGWYNMKYGFTHANPQTMEEAHALVSEGLEVAGGKHSGLIEATTATQNDTASWVMPTLTVADDIAQITLPHFMGNKKEGIRYAETILNGLPETLKGAVIDLRGNTGGNMYPMIAAIHPLLPDDNILGFRSRKSSSYVNTDYVCRVVGVTKQPHLDCPTAILIDSLTASSGEATLICFRGLEQVRTFGHPTAGYASGNIPYTMPDGSILILTTSKDVARTGEEFCDDPIAPDSLTETPLADALQWLKATIQDKTMVE